MGAMTHTELDSTASEKRVPDSLQRVVCVSVSYQTLPSEQVGAIAPEDPLALARRVKARDRITECVILSTCNRVELYTSTRTPVDDDIEAALLAAREELGEPDGLETYVGLDAVDHLSRVACGLESEIFGEDQILGQVNDAFETACAEGLAGGILSRIADVAVRVGRKARDETCINDGECGYGGSICRYIQESLDRPPDRVLLIGAGEMSACAATAIDNRWSSRIDVANRSETAELTTADGLYWPLEEVSSALEGADVVVTATGAMEPILSTEELAHCDPGTPVVDLANPPDVPAAARESDRLDVVTLEELAARVRERSQSRRAAAREVEELIEDSLDRLVTREYENRAEDTLRALHRKARDVRRDELQRARTRLEHGEEDTEAVLADFASAITGQLLADPTEQLRAAAREGDTETIRAANRLFEIDVDAPPAPNTEGATRDQTHGPVDRGEMR